MTKKSPKHHKPKSSVIESGGQYRIYTDAVKTYPQLPLGTYTVCFDPMMGHWLERIEDIEPSAEKMYGNGASRIERISAMYGVSQRSLGALLSGPGGMGKTMLMRALTHEIASRYQLPIIVVSSSSPGIASYIDSLGECVVMFDEFEKIFEPKNEDGTTRDEQVQFLSLFDGLSSTKRMYIVTVNDLFKVNSYMINRTGRFHYHLRFDFPTPEDITEYLTDAGVKPKQIKQVVAFASKVPINYDHLRSIAFELVNVGGNFTDLINDLNIKKVEPVKYDIIIEMSNGQRMLTARSIDLFSDDNIVFYEYFGEDRHYGTITFDPSRMTNHNGNLSIEGDDIVTSFPHADKSDRKKLGKATKVTMTLKAQTNIGY